MLELEDRSYGYTAEMLSDIPGLDVPKEHVIRKIVSLDAAHGLGIKNPEHLTALEYLTVRSLLDPVFAMRLVRNCLAPGGNRNYNVLHTLALVRQFLDYNDVSGYRMADIKAMLPGYITQPSAWALAQALRERNYKSSVVRRNGDPQTRRWCKVGTEMPDVLSDTLFDEEAEKLEAEKSYDPMSVYDMGESTPGNPDSSPGESSTPEVPEEISFM
jgi:hypothetical protein